MTYLEFITNKAVSSVFDFVLNDSSGTKNDRMYRHLKKMTREDGTIDDLFHKQTIFTRDLIVYLVEKRIQRYDLAPSP